MNAQIQLVFRTQNLEVSWFLDDEDDEEDTLTGKANEAFATQDKPTEVAAYSETKETVNLSTITVSWNIRFELSVFDQ